ncbi:MAG: xylulokinase [Terriglobales bacterium]
MRCWLGIDVGTTGTRALLIDSKGKIVAAATADHPPIHMPEPQWAEQDPADWWRAAKTAIPAALNAAGITGTQVVAVGLTGQMHGLVLLDAADKVLGNSLIWCDQRSQGQVDWINGLVGAENVLRWTCNPPLTAFTAPKLLWVRQHRPELYGQARKLLLPKDYVRFCLTGEYATEVSDASGTGLFDVAGRRWSAELVSALQVDHSLLPRVEESTVITGTITRAAAEATGLLAGTPVVGGGGDQAAGGVGNGVVKPGLVSATIGSSGVVFAAADTPSYDPRGRIHTFCHAVPGKWHVMGVTQGAGISLRWLRDQLGNSYGATNAYDEITAAAAAVPPGSSGLIFLPYMMGERTPHLDPHARGAWIGLTAAHTRGHLARAVLEGVAFSLRDTLEIFRSLGVPIAEVRLAGGGARSALWREIQAEIYRARCIVLESTEGAAYGAAILAMVGTREFSSVEEACEACIRVRETVGADPAFSAFYEELYAEYGALYPALRRSMHNLGRLERRLPASAAPSGSGP